MNIKKALLLSLPIIAGTAFIWWYLHKQKIANDNKPATLPPPAPNPNTEPKTNVIQASNPYPLKSGSRGTLVKDLQTILNSQGAKLIVDGIFGPKTQAALVKAYGNNQIKSASDFAAFKNAIQTQADKNTMRAMAQVLITAYNKNANSQVYTTLATTARVIIVNTDGSYTETGKVIDFDKLQMFPHGRFVPHGITNNGELKATYTTPIVPVSFTILVNPAALQLI